MVSDQYIYHRSTKLSNFPLLDTELDVGIEPSIAGYLAMDYRRASPTVQLAHSKTSNAATPAKDEPILNNEEELLPLRIAAPAFGKLVSSERIAAGRQLHLAYGENKLSEGTGCEGIFLLR